MAVFKNEWIGWKMVVYVHFSMSLAMPGWFPVTWLGCLLGIPKNESSNSIHILVWLWVIGSLLLSLALLSFF
jgi:hypothetical protein